MTEAPLILCILFLLLMANVKKRINYLLIHPQTTLLPHAQQQHQGLIARCICKLMPTDCSMIIYVSNNNDTKRTNVAGSRRGDSGFFHQHLKLHSNALYAFGITLLLSYFGQKISLEGQCHWIITIRRALTSEFELMTIVCNSRNAIRFGCSRGTFHHGLLGRLVLTTYRLCIKVGIEFATNCIHLVFSRINIRWKLSTHSSVSEQRYNYFIFRFSSQILSEVEAYRLYKSVYFPVTYPTTTRVLAYHSVSDCAKYTNLRMSSYFQQAVNS